MILSLYLYMSVYLSLRPSAYHLSVYLSRLCNSICLECSNSKAFWNRSINPRGQSGVNISGCSRAFLTI